MKVVFYQTCDKVITILSVSYVLKNSKDDKVVIMKIKNFLAVFLPNCRGSSRSSSSSQRLGAKGESGGDEQDLSGLHGQGASGYGCRDVGRMRAVPQVRERRKLQLSER